MAEASGCAPPCDTPITLAELERRLARLEHGLPPKGPETDCDRLRKTVEAQEFRIKNLEEKVLSLLARLYPPPTF